MKWNTFVSYDEDDTVSINEDEIEFDSDDDMVGVIEGNNKEDLTQP